MHKIAFVIPYFVREGKLPNYFQLWLWTAGWNKNIDFLIFTDSDIKGCNIPENVKTFYIEWEKMQNRIREMFDFKVAIDSPYKLCDYKVAYGEIFERYLTEYDFWGYCDIDLFFGNILKFVTEDLLERYDRIYTRGHCCIYRNTPIVNSWYRNLPCKGYQNWKDVFSTSKNCCFDEWAEHCGGGMSMIIKANDMKVYDGSDFVDLNINKGWFYPIGKEYKGRKLYFLVNSDGCFAYEDDKKVDEIAYVHFQKRKLDISLPDVGGERKEQFFFSAPTCVSNKHKSDMVKVIKYEIVALWKRIFNKLKVMRVEKR